MISSDWLTIPYPHFTPILTVSLSEFSAWAENEGLAGHDEIARLLADQPKVIPGPAEILKAAFPIFGGAGRHDPSIIDAGLYPREQEPDPVQQSGPVVADQCAPTVDEAQPAADLQSRVKQRAAEITRELKGSADSVPSMTTVAKKLESEAASKCKSGSTDHLYKGGKGAHTLSWYKRQLKGWQPEK